MRNKSLVRLVLICLVLSISGCASLGPRPALTVSEKRIHLLEQHLDEQSAAVKNFISTGTLQIWGPDQRIPTSFLCVGSRNPFRLKVEITHTWGLPLLHILMDGQSVTVVDLYHHKTYHSQAGNELPLFGKMPLINRALLWSVMRAFPELVRNGRVSWSNEDDALVVKQGEEVAQEIKFDGKLHYPVDVLYPKLEVETRFSSFTARGGFVYAKAVQARHLGSGASVHIRLKNILFNQDLNPQIFKLD